MVIFFYRRRGFRKILEFDSEKPDRRRSPERAVVIKIKRTHSHIGKFSVVTGKIEPARKILKIHANALVTADRHHALFNGKTAEIVAGKPGADVPGHPGLPGTNWPGSQQSDNYHDMKSTDKFVNHTDMIRQTINTGKYIQSVFNQSQRTLLNVCHKRVCFTMTATGSIL
ncbi:MAG: hypothetical protein ACD_39C02062G0003 [uncultured bacterium]|nr:MAG: hypothetical protein ACD_39C02062G0003 [uncultured bacterium]